MIDIGGLRLNCVQCHENVRVPESGRLKLAGGTKTAKDTLVCKYCVAEIDVLSDGKKPWDRIKEHLASKRHAKLKEQYSKRAQEGQQLSLRNASKSKAKRESS